MEVAVEHVLVAGEEVDGVGAGERGGPGAAVVGEPVVVLFDLALGVKIADASVSLLHVGAERFENRGKNAVGILEIEVLDVEATGEAEKRIGDLLGDFPGVFGGFGEVLFVDAVVVQLVFLGSEFFPDFRECGAGARPGGFVEVFADGAGVEALGAGESPADAGDSLDEEAFKNAFGAKLFAESFEEGVELLGGFRAVARSDEDVSGEQAVGEGVLGGGFFALLGGGAGGTRGVPAVGLTASVGNG